MKAFYVSKNKRAKTFSTTADIPIVGDNDVLVKMVASSINPYDVKYIKLYGWLLRFSPFSRKLTIGYDVSGVVSDVGKDVTAFKKGDEVYTKATKPGAFAEYITISESLLLHKPDSYSYIEAAAVSLVGLTGIYAFTLSKLQKGESVLVIGGSGGVGHISVQIAKLMGAEVTAVCSDKNLDFVSSLGPGDVIDYTNEKFQNRSKIYDVIFDTIGHESYYSCKNVLAENGRFVCIAPPVSAWLHIFFTRVKSALGLKGPKSYMFISYTTKKMLKPLDEWMKAGLLKIKIDSVFPIDQLDEALEKNSLGRTRGKIVISIDEEVSVA